MHIIKPNWVQHEDDKGHPQTIYSVHIHPDGTRLATGSIQNVVKVWSTAPILDPDSELSGEEKVPRLLCRMEGHDGMYALPPPFTLLIPNHIVTPIPPSHPDLPKLCSFNLLSPLPGAVLSVRWTHTGGFLATGSDDSIIMVWLR